MGGPTILATFTVIAALLPMAFVSGLMGPYMGPIPINASMGMLISLAVALIFTPWLCRKLFASERHDAGAEAHAEGKVHRFFVRLMTPFLLGDRARKLRHRLYLGTAAAIIAAALLAVVQLVVLKMLPFDNKSEFQVVVNMPEGTPVEGTARVLAALASIVRTIPEVTDYQAYAGTAAPDQFQRPRAPVLSARRRQPGRPAGQSRRQARPQPQEPRYRAGDPSRTRRRGQAAGRILRADRRSAAGAAGSSPAGGGDLRTDLCGAGEESAVRCGVMFDATPDIVDTDDTLAAPASRYLVALDRAKAALLGVSQAEAMESLAIALAGEDATFIHSGRERDPIAVRLEFGVADKEGLQQALGLPLRAASGTLVPLSEVASISELPWDAPIYHKDSLPVVFVTGDMAGRLDSPLYGMFSLVSQISKSPPAGQPLTQRFITSAGSTERIQCEVGRRMDDYV